MPPLNKHSPITSHRRLFHLVGAAESGCLFLHQAARYTNIILRLDWMPEDAVCSPVRIPLTLRGCVGLVTRPEKNHITQETTISLGNNRQNKMTTFNFRTRTRIGTWNVRSLSEPSKIEQLCREMSHYNLDILGVAETRWTGQGDRRMASGHRFLFSGNPSTRINGVGLLLSSKAASALIEFKPVSERIITSRFHSKFRKITIIHAPTDPDNDENKDAFYDLLENTFANVPKGDIVIALGDFNAKVGSDNTNYESIMGRHGLGKNRSNNGERLLEFCADQHLFVGGTRFPHRDIHKYTWQSPNGKIRNQIDHILISRRFHNTLLNVVPTVVLTYIVTTTTNGYPSFTSRKH